MSTLETIRSEGRRCRAWITTQVNVLSARTFKRNIKQSLIADKCISPDFEEDGFPMASSEVLVLRKHLIDNFLPVIAYVQDFSLAPAGSADTLEKRLSELIAEARTQSVNDDFAVDEFNEALFPVLAWIDERVSLLHPWEGAHAWQDHLLQRVYFRTSLAGVEFFERLEDLENSESSVREVFLFCLCMGFMGKYNNQPAEATLANLRVSQYRILQGKGYVVQYNLDTPLCPFAYQNDNEVIPTYEARWRRWLNPMAIAIVVVPVIVFLMIVFMLDYRLGESVDAFRRATQL